MSRSIPARALRGESRCLLCPCDVNTADLLDHLRLVHPDAYGDGPARWPDGRLVIVDHTLSPADFTLRHTDKEATT